MTVTEVAIVTKVVIVTEVVIVIIIMGLLFFDFFFEYTVEVQW